MLSSTNFAQPDITLKLDLAGVIRWAALSSAIPNEGVDGWVDRPWVDTVSEDGNVHVRQMLEDARTAGVSFFHQVRQRFPSGLELAVEYTTVNLGGNEGLVAIGRNLEAVADLRSRLLAAQKSMERDYWKLRDVETRYRLLFDASTQPVLLIGADDTRILEANPAAIRALGVTSDRELLPEILATQRDMFRAMLARVREQGKAPGVIVHLGPDRQPWLLRASLLAAEPAAVFVLQLSPSGVVTPLGDKGGAGRLEEVLARLPESFVVLDAEGKILFANRTFLDLIDQTSEGAVLGQSLGRWMPRPGADNEALLASLQRHRAVSQFKTILRGELGTEVEVEISAATSADEQPRYIGLLVRRLAAPEKSPAQPAPPSAAQQAALIGKLTLREIVQETVSSVERSCVETALELANGNRTAAAEMLGVSRQSLYSKLSRYALDPKDPSGSP